MPEGYINVPESTVLDTTIGLLRRETLLAATVWRDAVSDFTGQLNDTVTLRLPAYGVAGKRNLRASGGRTKSKLHERAIPVTLDTELFHDVPLTPANETLDLRSVTAQVIVPSTIAIREGIESEVAGAMDAADYENSIVLGAGDLDDDGNLPTDMLFDARAFLNDASVPMSNRYVVLGSALEALLLKGSGLRDASQAGDNDALRDASVGRVAGFSNVFVSSFIHPFKAYAYHRSAFTLASRAPVVPRGVAWGSTTAVDGFAIRVMEHLSENDGGVPVNVVYTDAFVGTAPVTDSGSYNAYGKFEPAVDPDESGEDDLLIRAVEIDGTALAGS